jgi:hypothetical protein
MNRPTSLSTITSSVPNSQLNMTRNEIDSLIKPGIGSCVFPSYGRKHRFFRSRLLLIVPLFAICLLCATLGHSQSPPFRQAPPIGNDTSAAILLVIDADGSLRVKTDPSQGPFDAEEDTLFGVQNNSTKTILAIPIRSSQPVFAFDGDGFDTVDPHPSGAPFGPTGYEGPGVSFTGISADATSGTVNFVSGIPPGGSAYFGLELAISTLCPPISGVPLIKQSMKTDLLDGLPANYCPAGEPPCKPGTIAYFGCAITSCAMLINYVAGADVATPETLNTYLKNRPDGYFGASVNWQAVVSYAATLNVTLSYKGSITHRDDFTLDSYLCSGMPVILSVLNNGHFVLATGQTTTVNGFDTYLINDPGAYANDATLEQPFNNTYSGLRPFSTLASPPSALYIVAHSPVELLISDPSGAQTGSIHVSNSTLENIPGSSYGSEALVEDVDGSGLATPKVKVLEIINPADGRYSLKVQGTATGPYSLEFWAYDSNGRPSNVMITGQASPGSLASYTVTYASTPGSQVVVSPAPGTLGNISTRGVVGIGDEVMIGGFIVAGAGNKTVLLRAIGPSLSDPPFNLANTLQDPTLSIFGSGGMITSNDNWSDAANAGSIDASLRPSNSAESAILISLAPGAYTAIVRGANGGTGIGLVEVFDLDATVPSNLSNISTRGLVEAGDSVMIGGFIINGPISDKVVVRAIGPSLASPPFNLTNVLQNPTLSLFNDQGSRIQSNDDWRSDQEVEIIATGLEPSNDAESALVRTLTPGNYTAIVSGVTGATGIALVEVYGLN